LQEVGSGSNSRNRWTSSLVSDLIQAAELEHDLASDAEEMYFYFGIYFLSS